MQESLRRALALVVISVSAVPALVAPHEPPGTDPQWPDPVEYVQAAEDILDGTYATGRNATEGRFPPGYPLLITPFVATDSVEIGAKLWVLVLYGAVVGAAVRLGGWLAGAVAAVMIGFAPFMTASARVVMSDAAATACAIGALMLTRLGGWLAGYGVVIRYASAGWAMGLAFVRRRYLPALAVTAAAILLFQWLVHGSPLETGYSDQTADFGLAYFVDPGTAEHHWYGAGLDLPEHLPPQFDPLPHFVVYPLVLVGWYTVLFYPPGLTLIGAWELWRRRRTDLGRAAIALIAGNLAVHLFFFGQSPRLVAPAGMVLVIFTAVGVQRLVTSRDAPQGALFR